MGKEELFQKKFIGTLYRTKEGSLERKTTTLCVSKCFVKLQPFSDKVRATVDKVVQKSVLYWPESSQK